MSNSIKVSEAIKHSESPFLSSEILRIDKGKKTIIAGSTKDVLINSETGEVTGATILHKYKEVDKEQFVKLFIGEVSALFDLTKPGLKVFGYLLQALPINRGEVYIHIQDLIEYCGYSHKNQVYKGLGELIANNIVAMSNRPNVWYINPSIVFNGDRIAFVKEYRLKVPELPKQLTLDEHFEDEKI